MYTTEEYMYIYLNLYTSRSMKSRKNCFSRKRDHHSDCWFIMKHKTFIYGFHDGSNIHIYLLKDLVWNWITIVTWFLFRFLVESGFVVYRHTMHLINKSENDVRCVVPNTRADDDVSRWGHAVSEGTGRLYKDAQFTQMKACAPRNNRQHSFKKHGGRHTDV